MRNKQKILLWLSKRKEKIAALLYRFYEPITYLIFGILTTIVNVVVSRFLKICWSGKLVLSNLPAIFLPFCLRT